MAELGGKTNSSAYRALQSAEVKLTLRPCEKKKALAFSNDQSLTGVARSPSRSGSLRSPPPRLGGAGFRDGIADQTTNLLTSLTSTHSVFVLTTLTCKRT